MTKTEELLAVLDMPKKEQLEWLNNYLEMERFGNHRSRIAIFHIEELADLAFRLRDEVEDVNWLAWKKAQETICLHLWKNKPTLNIHWEEIHLWFTATAKPIHWIIAALIAKQKEKPDGK